MAKWFATVFLVLFLSGSVFAAEPFHANYSLTKGKPYDDTNASREISDDGTKITVKTKNMSWSNWWSLPKETRTMDKWKVGVTVVDYNGACFGLNIGNNQVAIDFEVNTSGEYRVSSRYAGSQSKTVKWGNSQSFSLPARLEIEYDLGTSRFVGRINDLTVVSIQASDFPSLPRFVTVTEIGTSTRTKWSESHRWALYKDLTVDASR